MTDEITPQQYKNIIRNYMIMTIKYNMQVLDLCEVIKELSLQYQGIIVDNNAETVAFERARVKIYNAAIELGIQLPGLAEIKRGAM